MSHCFAQHVWYSHAASFGTTSTTTTTTSSSPKFLECWESDCDFTLAMANTLVVRDVSSVLCWANYIEYTVKGGWVSRLFVTSSVHVYLWSSPQTCFYILCSVPYQIQLFKVIGIFCDSMQSSTASKDWPGNEASFSWKPETSSTRSVLLVRGRVFHGKEAG